MKKFLLLLAFAGLVLSAKTQNVGVDKSVTGIQTGFFGTWIHRETKLSNSVALRTEFGLDAGIWSNTFKPPVRYALIPVINVEPRWYYDLKKRHLKSKNISGNSGNFLTLQTRFYPNWFIISNSKNTGVISQISFVPSWGIRRVVGKHFTYEAGIGYGYAYVFYKSAGYSQNKGERAANLLLRVGYRF